MDQTNSVHPKSCFQNPSWGCSCADSRAYLVTQLALSIIVVGAGIFALISPFTSPQNPLHAINTAFSGSPGIFIFSGGAIGLGGIGFILSIFFLHRQRQNESTNSGSPPDSASGSMTYGNSFTTNKATDEKKVLVAPEPIVLPIPDSKTETENTAVPAQIILSPAKIPLKSNHCFFGKCYSHEMQGRRSSMEDRTLIWSIENFKEPIKIHGVFDGHGGIAVADILHDNFILAFRGILLQKDDLSESSIKAAIDETIKRLDEKAKETKWAGSCVAMTITVGSTLYIVNIGDSRTVFCHDGVAIACSEDAKPTNARFEKEIESLGGVVFWGKVGGQLAVARSVGDWNLSTAQGRVITSKPDISTIDLTTASQGDFVIIACDGVWDKLSNQDAVDVVINSSKDSAKNPAIDLAEAAYDKGSKDNISAIVIPI